MPCILWLDRYMIPPSPKNEKRRLMPMDAASQERRRVGDALYTVYITFPVKGNNEPIVRASDCASSGGLSPRVAADPAVASVEIEGPQDG